MGVPRKVLFTLLACLGLLEVGVLLLGFVHRHGPKVQPAPPAWAFPYHSEPEALTVPALHLQPQDGIGWLYALVNQTRSTLDMTMYELVDPTFSAALVAACQRGVQVRVILDGGLERSANSPAFQQLSTAGTNCQVVWSNPQFHATHQKSLVLDRATAVVMTLNLAERFYSSSRDLALVDTDVTDIAAIEITFNKDFEASVDRNYNPHAGHNLIWSPTSAQDDLTQLIASARQTLLVENEELSAASIVTALGDACRRGVRVSLVMTDTSPLYHANFQALQAAGCGVHIGANDPSTLYIHAKAILADTGTPQALGYVGSINFSNASLQQNRELGMYVRDAGLLNQLASTLTGDYNRFPTWNAARASDSTLPPRP